MAQASHILYEGLNTNVALRIQTRSNIQPSSNNRTVPQGITYACNKMLKNLFVQAGRTRTSRTRSKVTLAWLWVFNSPTNTQRFSRPLGPSLFLNNISSVSAQVLLRKSLNNNSPPQSFLYS